MTLYALRDKISDAILITTEYNENYEILDKLEIPDDDNIINYKFSKTLNKIVNVYELNEFWVDNNGNKYVDPCEDCQKVICKYNDELIFIDGVWTILTDDLKQVIALNKKTTNYILTYYPTIKQQSDISDKVYYETILRYKGYDNIDSLIVNMLNDYTTTNSISQTLTNFNIPDEDKYAFTQLLKIAIRVSWVQQCKEAYRVAKTTGTLELPEPFNIYE